MGTTRQNVEEVSRAILKRAALIKQANLEILENITLIRDQMDFAIKESLMGFLKNADFRYGLLLFYIIVLSILLAEKLKFKELKINSCGFRK